MPDRLLLIFPNPEPVERPKGSGHGSRFPRPTDKEGQAKRVEQHFAQVQTTFVSDEPGDVERVLVMETSSRVEGLQNAVERVKGLEWLSEIDVDDIELHDLYDEVTGTKVKGGRFYLLSSNKQAVDRLLGLWNQYKDKPDQKFDYGLGKFKDVFAYLLTLRRWDVRDRLRDTGILDVWKDEYQAKRGTSSDIEFEIELHYWRSEDKRNRSFQEVVQKIESAGGSVDRSTCMEEIAFHALKVTLPVNSIDKVMEHDWGLGEPVSTLSPVFHSESVKYVRPIGQNIDAEGELEDDPLDILVNPIKDKKPPVLALLDGAPLLRHTLLDDRINFFDPESYMDAYEPSQQKHGTAMASLICHGDLSRRPAEIKSLPRPIYARPVMKPHPFIDKEEIPSENFQEDIIERAVHEMFEGEFPAAPHVCVVNISLGNIDQHYLHEMSPWARLLDWLSFRYKVLFIVSAGNYNSSIRLAATEGTDQSSLFDSRQEVLGGIDKDQRNHRLISPAESLNALTVGALQGDASGDLNSLMRGFDPIDDMDLPAPYSRIGPGYRGSIKPDMYTRGGRLLYDRDQNDGNLLEPVNSYTPPGIQVACPSSRPEVLINTSYQAGTSQAAAIITHNAGHIFEVLEELRSEDPETLPSDFNAVLIKTLLVHGTSQGQNDTEYEHLKNSTNKMRFARYLARYLGFGNIDIERVLACTRTRATAIGYGNIEDKQRHRFIFPLPIGTAIHDHLRLTITLAWFSPINPFHIGMRRAKLFFEGSDLKGKEGHERQECDWQQVRKGTVQHEIFALKKSNLPGDELELFVECAADAGTLDDKIPYGLAVTLEVAEQESIDLYELVRERIRPRVPVAGARNVSI